jgi:hypothetical protein
MNAKNHIKAEKRINQIYLPFLKLSYQFPLMYRNYIDLWTKESTHSYIHFVLNILTLYFLLLL